LFDGEDGSGGHACNRDTLRLTVKSNRVTSVAYARVCAGKPVQDAVKPYSLWYFPTA